MTDKTNYINNEEFLKALMDYKKAVRKAKKEGLPKPGIPTYIGECFWKIAEQFSHSPKFIRYSYRDEMVADGVENCLMYFENFDSKITKNPFGYFTQIIYFAFIRRIAKEHKQQYVKYKSISQSGVYDQLTGEDIEAMGEDGAMRVSSMAMGSYDNISVFIEHFEKGIAEKKAKKAITMKAKAMKSKKKKS